MNRALCFVLLACGCASTSGASSTTPANPSSTAGSSDASDAGTAAAASGPSASASSPSATGSGSSATANIEPRSGSALSGTSRFSPANGGGLAAHAEVQNATPGQHGIHVHEKGDCSDPKAVSAGPHFNPAASPHHGGPATPVRHGGDLGNITVDNSGKGVLDVVVYGVSLDGSDGVVGRSIVVHEKVDDLHSDPAGNSGGRIGCGVIQR